MKFIELTDRYGDKVTINFDKIERFMKVKEKDETFTRLDFVNDSRDYYIYVKETYQQVKEALGV